MRYLEIWRFELLFFRWPIEVLTRKMPEPSQHVDQLPPENQHLLPSSQSAIPVRMPLHGVIIRQPGNEVYGKFHNLEAVSRQVFCKKGVLKKITKFTGKHLYESLFFNKAAGIAYNFIKKETLVQLFSCEFCKFLRTPFFQNISGGCFCQGRI